MPKENTAVAVVRLSAEEYAASIVAAEQRAMTQLSLRMYEYMQKHPGDIFYMLISHWEWRECDDALGGFELRVKARFEHDKRQLTEKNVGYDVAMPAYDRPVAYTEAWYGGTTTITREDIARVRNISENIFGNAFTFTDTRGEDIPDENEQV